MSVNLLIAADIVPTKSNQQLFTNGDIIPLIGEALARRFKEADFIAMNLEVPLVDKESPISKCGPCLIASTSSVTGLKAINPFFYTLANNHIMDQGVAGLKSTMSTLSGAGIAYAGAGLNIDEAKISYVTEVNGVIIGVYCCAEHEFSIASKYEAGANPFDPLVSFDEVKTLKEKCDFLIVLYHGGKEQYRYPSPQLQRVFHKFAESGADLVVAQHTHCVGCMEEYLGATLVYGQGNFLFDYSDNVFWDTSLIIGVSLDDNKKPIIEYIPLIKDENGVKEAVSDIEIIRDFKERSREIQTEGTIETKYREYAKQMLYEYLIRISGKKRHSVLFRLLNKISGYKYVYSQYSREDLMLIQNVIDCEAHKELFLIGLKER